MGIKGLLRSLKPLLKDNLSVSKHNIRQFSNKTIAIDASSWLHKAGYACAERLVESTENNTVDTICIKIYTKYVIQRCEELLFNANIAAILLVFDGTRCPLKADTNKEREEKRKQNMEEARRLKNEGKYKEAQGKYRNCVKVTDAMIENVAKVVKSKFSNDGSCKNARVQMIYSPYESDAQLAQLCLDGFADAVVTEDSDLILYSLSCGNPFPIIYKLDRDTGSCDVISMSWLLSQAQGDSLNDCFPTMLCKKSKSTLAGFLRLIALNERRDPGAGCRMFIQACVLSGCDYVSNLPGIGLVTAFQMITEHSKKDPNIRFRLALMSVKGKSTAASDKDSFSYGHKKTFPPNFDFVEYESSLVRSEAAFYYHLVWRRNNDSVSYLNDPKTQTSLSNLSSGERNSSQRHLPATDLYEHDLSFLGSARCASSCVKKNLSTLIKPSTKFDQPALAHFITPRAQKKRQKDPSPLICAPGVHEIKASKKGRKKETLSTTSNDSSESDLDNDGLNKIFSKAEGSVTSACSLNDLLDYNPFSKFALDSENTSDDTSRCSTSQTKNCPIHPKLNKVSLESTTARDDVIYIDTRIATEKSKGFYSHELLSKKSPFFSHVTVEEEKVKGHTLYKSKGPSNALDVTPKLSSFDMLSNRNNSRAVSCQKEDDYDERLTIDEPELPRRNHNASFTGTEKCSPSFVSPYSSTHTLKKIKSFVPKTKKKKSKYTIMDGFHRQQQISRENKKKKKSRLLFGTHSGDGKKSNSIKKFFSPLPVRKIFN